MLTIIALIIMVLALFQKGRKILKVLFKFAVIILDSAEASEPKNHGPHYDLFTREFHVHKKTGGMYRDDF